MLSICIPHFNFENPLLFKELEKQCKILNINFEIIVADDASESKFTTYLREFEQKDNFSIIYLDKNIGRSRIRNLLVQNSKYDLLLFLDGDSGIASAHFIETHLKAIQQFDIISGGRAYAPLNSRMQKLHWIYGTKTESLSNNNFHSNNFIINKKVFDKVIFDESITLYGYEDAVFGVMASLKGFKYLKIENPVIHLQLKNNQQFLEDTASAIKNICYIKKNKPELTESLHLTILNFYLKIRSWGFHHLLNLTENVMINFLYEGLLKNRFLFPLNALKLYKLYVLNRLMRENYK